VVTKRTQMNIYWSPMEGTQDKLATRGSWGSMLLLFQKQNESSPFFSDLSIQVGRFPNMEKYSRGFAPDPRSLLFPPRLNLKNNIRRPYLLWKGLVCPFSWIEPLLKNSSLYACLSKDNEKWWWIYHVKLNDQDEIDNFNDWCIQI